MRNVLEFKLDKLKELSTGIFWFDTEEETLIVTSVYCGLDGNPNTFELFNSKSGKTFNHEKSWKDIQHLNKKYRQYNYNYFPRGRVMIKNNKAEVYYNPHLHTSQIQEMILSKFGLHLIKNIQWIVDNSQHYQCYLDKE